MCTILEPFRKPDSSNWMPSKDRLSEIYWNRQKASLWQEAMGNTQTGMKAHTETVETILVGQWECVSAYYLLWFQVFTFLGFIMWRMCCCRVSEVRSATQTEGLFILRLESAKTPGEKEGEDSREMCWAILQFRMCPILFFSPWLQIFWCPRTAEKMNASILSTVLFCLFFKKICFSQDWNIEAYGFGFHWNISRTIGWNSNELSRFPEA